MTDEVSGLVERLWEIVDESWPYARLLSNTGHPERDNNVGRAVTAMREAAAALARLQAENERLRAERDRAQEVGIAALAYIDESPCDPDITRSQAEAWAILQDVRARTALQETSDEG